MTCGFEQWDTQCSAMLNITVGGDDYDPIYNTGERISIYNTGMHNNNTLNFWLLT